MFAPVDLGAALHMPPAGVEGAAHTQSLYTHTWCQDHPFGIADHTSGGSGLDNASALNNTNGVANPPGATDAGAASSSAGNAGTSTAVTGDSGAATGNAAAGHGASGTAGASSNLASGGENQEIMDYTFDHSNEVRVQDGFAYTYHELAVVDPSTTAVQREVDTSKRVNPGIGHASMIGHSMVFGVLSGAAAVKDQAVELRRKDQELRGLQTMIESMKKHEATLMDEITDLQAKQPLQVFCESFQKESCNAAGAVTPLGQFIMQEHIFKESQPLDKSRDKIRSSGEQYALEDSRPLPRQPVMLTTESASSPHVIRDDLLFRDVML